MWINLDEKNLKTIRDGAGFSHGFKHPTGGLPGYDELMKKLDDAEKIRPSDDAYRNAVETSDDLEVDEDAVVSPGSDPGAWVHAWTWVTDEQAGIEPEDEEEGEDGQAEETA